MNHLTCTACNKPIAAGEALIRSRSLVAVPFHQGCYIPAPALATSAA